MVNVWLFITHVWQHGSDSLEAPHLVITTFAQMQTFDSCVVKPTVSTPRALWLLIKIQNESDAYCQVKLHQHIFITIFIFFFFN